MTEINYGENISLILYVKFVQQDNVMEGMSADAKQSIYVLAKL